MEDNKKLRALIRACWIVLIAIWLICFISGEKLNVFIHNERLIAFGNFIDNNLFLKYPLKFLSFYLNTILVFYAIFKKKIFSYKVIPITIYSIVIWIIKILFIDYAFIDYIDFVSILFVLIIDKKYTIRAIIGNILLFIFILISGFIKNFIGINTAHLPFIIQTTLMIDVILMCLIYYLYSRKEGNTNERYGLVFWKNKDLENRKWHFSNIISSCRNNYRSFISCLKTDGWKIYCSIIFFIITYGSILIVGYFLNRIIEATIAVICFHIFRKYDKKTYHADTTIRCWLVSFISFGVLTKLATPITHSIFVTIMLSYLLTKIMYYTQELIEHLQDNKITKDLIRLENMSKEQLQEMFSEYSTNDINAIYMCLHKDRSTNYEYIAYKHSMSRMTLYRIMKKIRSQYNSLYNK